MRKYGEDIVIGTMGWRVEVIKFDGCGNGAGNNSCVFAFVDTDLRDEKRRSEVEADIWESVDEDIEEDRKYSTYPYDYALCLCVPDFGYIQIASLDTSDHEINIGGFCVDNSDNPIPTLEEYRALA